MDAGQIPTTTCDSAQGVVTISQNGTTAAGRQQRAEREHRAGHGAERGNAPAAGPNAENIAETPNGSQTEGPSTAPMTPTSGPTPVS